MGYCWHDTPFYNQSVVIRRGNDVAMMELI
jgi:hypothetical protein